jgi:hypothetical protein
MNIGASSQRCREQTRGGIEQVAPQQINAQHDHDGGQRVNQPPPIDPRGRR